MKSFYSLVFLLLLNIPFGVKAQQNHFIYFQTEGRQPFYAKLDKKVLSSSASGYLIIPKLKDGTYNISIGFAKNENGEQNYVCTIDNRNAGYLVKNFGDKGWGLFNLQTLDVVMSGNQLKEKDAAKVEKTDAFSTMLSDVVNDPTIKETEKPKEEIKQVTEKKVPAEQLAKPKVTEEKKQLVDITNTPQSAKEDKPQLTASTGSITKREINTDADGTMIVYIDAADQKPDTIRIFIPAEKTAANDNKETIIPKEITKKEEEPKQEVKIKQQSDEAKAAIDKDNTVTKQDTAFKTVVQEVKNDPPALEKNTKREDDKKFLQIELPSPNKKTDEKLEDKSTTPSSERSISQVEPVIEQEPKTQMINSDCKNYATEEDFLKLRKKMAAVDDEEEMVTIANKVFKTKCFTTSQVKNLSVLFLKDGGKYKFFDLAYQYASDSHNFYTLENQLTDPYYISRFKAMVKH